MAAAPEGGRDDTFMRAALSHALAARDCGEVPVGAVLVRDDAILAGEDVGARTLPPHTRLPVLPVQMPAFEHRMPRSDAMRLLQQRADRGLVRDGCGAETYACH